MSEHTDGEVRIRGFIDGVQATTNESMKLYAEAEPIRLLQDRLWGQYNETVLEGYRDIWDRTISYLQEKPADYIDCDSRSKPMACWNFENIVDRNGTKALITTTVGIIRSTWSRGNDINDLLIAQQIARGNIYKKDDVPVMMRGVKMRGFRVDKERARTMLRFQLGKEFIQDAGEITAKVTMVALGHDQQPEEVIRTAVYPPYANDGASTGARFPVYSFTPESALKFLGFLKERAQAFGRTDLDIDELTHTLTVDLKHYDNGMRPGFDKLAAVNDILGLPSTS